MLVWLVLFALQEPTETEPVHGRILDALSGAPVVGATCELWTEDYEETARLTDRATTDAEGRYLLRPRTRHEVKVRLLAPGYRGTVSSPDGGVEFLYPNDEPLRVRVRDLDGQPIAGARIRSHQTCRHAPPAVEGVSGPDGLVVLDGAPIWTSTDYEIRASGHGALVPVYFDDHGSELEVFLPRRAPVHLRLLDGSGQPLANHRFHQQGPGPTTFVTDASGRATLDSLYESREIGLRDSARRLNLFGWPPLEGELVLTPESPWVDDRDGWPTLRILGAEPHARVHVQFGSDSVTRLFDQPQVEVRVRPGERVVVLAQLNEVRRTELEPWSGTRTLDLGTADLIRPRTARGEPVRLAFRLRTPEGEPLAVEGELGGSYVDHPPVDEDSSPDGVAFHVSRGARYEIRFSAEGHLPLARIGRARETMPEPEVVVLPRAD